jgi:hypothetical protein
MSFKDKKANHYQLNIQQKGMNCPIQLEFISRQPWF